MIPNHFTVEQAECFAKARIAGICRHPLLNDSEARAMIQETLTATDAHIAQERHGWEQV